MYKYFLEDEYIIKYKMENSNIFLKEMHFSKIYYFLLPTLFFPVFKKNRKK